MAAQFLAHRFDLLGSGWVTVAHGIEAAGFEGIRFPAGVAVSPDATGRWLVDRIDAPNVRESQRIWSLIDPAYVPIDWQLDFKSGYRWSERDWYREARYGDVRGADVKVPWELGRMQHLPQMALAAQLARDSDPTHADHLATEFRNQVLDFVATNPPRRGVQWVMTMDVAIRVSNWVVAHDLFLGCGATFDDDFEQVLARTVREHAHHIATNLEWDPQLVGNHYLADLTGLLFAAAYLPDSKERDRWLELASREFLEQALAQFQPDGTNFEASTCYHRLSAEFATFGLALVIRLVESGDLRIEVPSAALERLAGAAVFTARIAKPNGRVPQIGDNDSGRFLKLAPVAEQAPGSQSWVEDNLDHRDLIDAIDGLLGRAAAGIDRHVVASLAGESPGRRAVSSGFDPATVRVGTTEDLRDFDARLEGLTTRRHRFALGTEVASKPAILDAFPDFGLFLRRTDHTYLAIRCGSVGQLGFGGHAHNDQLSIELVVDGQELIRDPGTYVYTPLPERRNAYRSAQAHFVPLLDGAEPAGFEVGLFRLRAATAGTCRYWGPEGFAGELRTADGRIALCRILFGGDALEVIHAAENGTLRSSAPQSLPYSAGYGLVER